MFKYSPVMPILAIVTTLLTCQPQSVLALESPPISAKIKELTVQIGGEATGTGTIIERQGDVYTVITCWHVVQSLGNYQVTTADGEKYQASEIKNLPNIDLATVKFTSNKVYRVSQLGDSQKIVEGTDTYVVGYPDPFPGIPDRTFTFLRADVVSKLSKTEQGYQIVHDNPSTPGGSGGGIFDINGYLIGVNGRFISEQNTGKAYGQGIPLQIYLATRRDLKIATNQTPTQDFVALGQKKLRQQNYQDAIALFNRALAANPSNLNAYYSRGAAFFSLQDYAAAINNFDRLLNVSPNYPLAYFYRGYIRAAKQDYSGAIADYNRAIELNANFDPAYTNRGFAYAKLGDTQSAIADYNRAIELNPESAAAYYNRGLAFGRDLGDYQQALADFTRSIKLAPEDAQVYTDRGNVYSLLKETQSAIDDYSQAINLNPQHAEAHYNRGLAYSQQNEPEKALADLQLAATAFQTQGDSANYQRALDRIREIQGI
jgi:tetratricopeptide (TPR) repeat protein